LSSLVTVSNVLRLPTLASSTVVAGHDGLDHPVWNVGVVAGTEVTEWVKPGAVLLSTGHPLSEKEPSSLPDMIRQLEARGVSCLAVRLGSYGFDFTPELVQAADAVGLPVVQLTDDFAFDDILIDVLSLINVSLREVTDFAEQVHAALIETVIDGASLRTLTHNIARLLSARVRIYDANGGLLAGGGPDSDAPSPPSWSSLEEAVQELGVRNEVTSRIVLRLGSGRSPLGYLECDRPSSPLSQAEVRATERASTVAALALAQLAAVRAVESNYQGEVLTRVLRNELADPGEIRRRLRDIGWDPRPPLIVVVIGLSPNDTSQTSHAMAWLRSSALPLARSALGEGASGDMVAVIGSDLILIGPETGSARLESVARRVQSTYAQRAHLRLPGRLGIGVSSPVAGIEDLSVGFDQAVVAANASQRSSGAGRPIRFADLGVLGLVLAASGPAGLSSMGMRGLETIERLPDRERNELLTTLRVVLENNLNLAESARLLHFHYNTLRRRVKRLEQLVGPFTTDADTRLALSLMLRIRDFRQGYIAADDVGH
jgi:purine catabolism regulator